MKKDLEISKNPIPCLFKYFGTHKDWTNGFAFLNYLDEGRAYIAFTPNIMDIIYYCHGENEKLSCCWIPDAPVLREIYDL